jgi:F-type H+-transporting ATPase subunit a
VSPALAPYLPGIVLVNFLLVGVLLLGLGRIAMARPLTELPDGAQNGAELVLEWFIEQARRIAPGSVTVVAPFLASLFLMILGGNLLAVLPIPLLRIPPAAYFSVPLGLALVAVLGSIVVGARLTGPGAAFKHLVWPNPLQLVGDVSHVLSLSLRLYGNIAGEFLVATLAASAAPYGVPLIIHALGLIPAVVQPLVFVLLTISFLATAVHTAPSAKPRESARSQ